MIRAPSARGLANFGADISAIAKDSRTSRTRSISHAPKPKRPRACSTFKNEFATTRTIRPTASARRFSHRRGGQDAPATSFAIPRCASAGLIGAGTDAVRVNDGINDHGVTVQREAETVAFDNALETNRRLYVDPNTPPDVEGKGQAGHRGRYPGRAGFRLLDPSSAEARKKTYIEDAEFSRGKLAVDARSFRGR
jgi:hypothetical protein